MKSFKNFKTFKKVKEGEQIFSVDSNGNVVAHNVIKKVEDWYEHMATFSFPTRDIRANMGMYDWIEEDDYTIRYFADKDNALREVREIAEKANKVVQNCLKSMDIFS